MKKRLYYVARTLQEADAMHEILRNSGIGDWNYHVVSKDDVGVYKYHFHAANPLQANDVIRQGERGAVIGLVAGLLVALVITGVFNYFPEHRVITFLVVTAVVMAHGIWTGGMVGLAQPNSKLRRYRAELEAGHYLFVVDLDRAHYRMVRDRLSVVPGSYRGESTTLVTPFG